MTKKEMAAFRHLPSAPREIGRHSELRPLLPTGHNLAPFFQGPADLKIADVGRTALLKTAR